MADCRVALSLNQQGTTVSPGGELTGEVVVHVDAPVTCNGLTVVPEWRTSGAGNAATGEGEKVVLFTGQWDAGAHRYRFCVRAPLGPFTYDGKLVDVRWNVKTRADVPWAIDPKAEAPFTLSAGKNASDLPYYFGPSYQPPDPKTDWQIAIYRLTEIHQPAVDHFQRRLPQQNLRERRHPDDRFGLARLAPVNVVIYYPACDPRDAGVPASTGAPPQLR